MSILKFFCREIMCSENLLNMDEKVDWRECKLEKAIEIEHVKKLRNEFSPFDFN